VTHHAKVGGLTGKTEIKHHLMLNSFMTIMVIHLLILYWTYFHDGTLTCFNSYSFTTHDTHLHINFSTLLANVDTQ
jgi:hypothetical protein